MKKIITLILSIVLIFSVMPMALSASAEGNVITVGEGGDYETLADAVTEATDGDTVQLVSDVTGQNSTITLKKSITIDTNGNLLSSGGEVSTVAGCKPKVNLINLTSGYELTITNSQRTAQVTTDDDFDIRGSSLQQGGIFAVNPGATINFKNIVVKDINVNTNNHPSVLNVKAGTGIANIILDNCYFISDKFCALSFNQDSNVNLIAKNSILSGWGSVAHIISQGEQNLSFENCALLSTNGVSIGVASSTTNTSITDGTNSINAISYTFNNCTGTKVYGIDLNVKFIGTNKFDTVCEKVVLSADESTGLYSDDTYETELTAGVLTADTPVYTKLLSSETSPVTMKSGASIRLNEQNGIRFYTTVDTAKLAELKNVEGNVVELGTLIAPADLVTGELTHSIGADNYVDVKYQNNEWFAENTFVGSIVNIKPANYGRAFIGRGYIKVTNGDDVTYYYAKQDDNARSVKAIASAYKADVNSGYSELDSKTKELVDNWAAAADWSAQ